MSALLLIDAAPFIYRGYYGAGDNPSVRSDGLPTAGVAGFLQRIWDHVYSDLSDWGFAYLVAVFDPGGGNWRHLMSTGYKADRIVQPDDLLLQLKLARHILPMMGIPTVMKRGFEADDLIATYTRRHREANGDVVILTSDKDLCSLVDSETSIFNPMKPRAKRWIRTEEVIAKFGVPPHQVPEVQGLMGDTIDGILGIPKIGPVNAAKLIQQFGNVENAIANAERANTLPVIKRNLVEYADRARLARKLVALDDDVPGLPAIETFARIEMDARRTIAALKALEIQNFTHWLGWKYGIDPEHVEPCEATFELAEELLQWKAA